MVQELVKEMNVKRVDFCTVICIVTWSLQVQEMFTTETKIGFEGLFKGKSLWIEILWTVRWKTIDAEQISNVMSNGLSRLISVTTRQTRLKTTRIESQHFLTDLFNNIHTVKLF